MKPEKLIKMLNVLLKINLLILIFLLTIDTIKAQSNIITFDEQRYKDVSGQLLYRGGPNTLTDTQLGLDFYIAFGSMKITPFNGDYMLYFTPFIGSAADPRGRIVITFNNLQQYVRIDVSTDGTPVQTPAYLRVSYYRSTDPSNPLYYLDGGGNIEYTNDSEGIKMLIVDTHFAENDIEELEIIPLGENPVLRPVPESPIALSGYNNSIPIGWKAPTGRTPLSYNIYRSTASGGSYQKIAGNLQHPYLRDNVGNNITYYYVVTAVYSDGESNYSAECSAHAQSQGNVSNSNWTFAPPTLDGIINTNEWSNASVTDISYPDGGGNVRMYAMNTDSKLYIAVEDSRDVNLVNDDNLSFFIDSDHNREWPASGTGHDGILRFIYNNGATVTYRSLYGYWPNQISGSEWFTPSGTQQAISRASGYMQYEISIDFNSDILNASPGSVIGLCCFVYDDNTSKFDGLKPYQTENLSPLAESVYWSYGPFAYMDFTIGKSNPTIVVNTPNGNESWLVGSLHNINWSSNDVANVKIEYSINNGTTWTSIISSTTNDGSYSWTIPNTPSTNCKVRISDASNSSTSDQSDGVFTISQLTKVTFSVDMSFVSPAITTNDIVAVRGSITPLTWDQNFNLLKTSGTNTYENTVEFDNSYNYSDLQYKFIIQRADGSIVWESNAGTGDMGNRVYNLKPGENNLPIVFFNNVSLMLISPNGGENWQAGTSYDIFWSSSNVTNAKIEYSTNNGTNWTNINSSTPSDGSYKWKIPNTPSTNCRVRISDASNSMFSDQSDNVFTISSQPTPVEITVQTPNGGEKWQVGTSQDINWNSSGVTNVKIEYSTNNGSSWINIISSTPNNDSYSWTIPNTPSANCRVRISDASNSSVSDESDNLFVIEIAGEQAAEFKNKGDYIEVPNSSTLTSSNFSIEFWLKVKQLGDPNAAGGEQTILDMRGNNNTGFNFRLAGTGYPISLFAIVLPGDVSTNNVINQNVWYHIAVTQDNTKLKLYLNGELVGESSNIYASNTQSPLRIGEFLGYPDAYLGLRGEIDELHFWNIVRSQEEVKSDMFAKLTGNESGLSACWDFNSHSNKIIKDLTANGNNGTLYGNTTLVNSDAPVGIVPPVVLTPNGGEKWQVDSQQSITWTSTNIDNVKIEYSTDRGRTWTSIIESTQSNGSYQWRIPNTPSTNCRVKISDILYSLANDISDNVFTIDSPAPAANFDASPVKGLQPLTVNFSDLSTGGITSWLWNFGDGSSGNEKNPVHTYDRVGTYSVQLTVTGTGGSNSITKENLVEVDSISWNVPSIINMGENVTVSATAPDYFKPAVCKLFYRMGGQTKFNETDFNTSNNLLSAEIPSAFSTIRGIEYYVRFYEGENTFTFPQMNPENHPAVICVKLQNIVPSASFQSMKYEMITIPLNLEDKNVMSYLIDSYGEYNIKQWRVFRWEDSSGSYQEYPRISSELKPGNAFWLITRNGDNFKLYDVKSINSSKPFVINLERGWNQIGNPFAFPVAWDSIQKSSESLQGPILWNSDPEQNTLIPWAGYWINNISGTEVTLSIPPLESTGMKKEQVYKNICPDEFILQIKEFNRDWTEDIHNYVGMLKNAKDGNDKYDIMEPPPISEKTNLTITRDGTEYIQNIVPVSSNGAFWDLAIHSNQSDKFVRLEFEKKSTLPEYFKIWFLDKNRMVSLPVVDNCLEFQLPEGGKGFYRLIIGKEEFAKQNSDKIPLVPLEYSLIQNYPNPFNSTTKITYNLREKSRVTLEIFDILGRKVDILINNELLGPGKHTAIWDGINFNGNNTSSGIYIYRIRANDFQDSKMMVQLK